MTNCEGQSETKGAGTGYTNGMAASTASSSVTLIGGYVSTGSANSVGLDKVLIIGVCFDVKTWSDAAESPMAIT